MKNVTIVNPMSAEQAAELGLAESPLRTSKVVSVDDPVAERLIASGYGAYGAAPPLPTLNYSVDGNLKIVGTLGSSGSAWDGSHYIMGVYHLWVDTTGKLRMKSGAPTSDTDGIIIGSGTTSGGTGTAGESAYQVAVRLGYSGTETQWVASLKGAKGDKGDTGERGATGLTGSTGRGFNHRGAWVVGTAYAVDDVFRASGSTFLVITAHTSTGSTPTAAQPGTNAVLWAGKGDPGPILAYNAFVMWQNTDGTYPARSTLTGVTAAMTVLWFGLDASRPSVGGSGMASKDAFFAIPAA